MKKLYTIILAILCLQGNAQFSGGSGTTSDPYVIANKNDLATLSNNSSYWDKHFIQTADIILTSADFQTGGVFYNNGEGFSPIGDVNTIFTGSYNGKGHTIDSLYINRPSSLAIGFFGIVGPGGSIDSLGLLNINITGGDYVGGICGSNDGGSIDNSYASGKVSGGSSVGGFCGFLDNNGVITRSNFTGNVSGSFVVGGFLGSNANGTIMLSSVTSGSVINNNNNYTGGFTGANQGLIKLCNVSNVSVSGLNYSGGFTGYNDANIDSCNVTNSYVWGSLNNTGGFVARNLGSINYSDFNGSVSCSGTNVGGFVGINEFYGGFTGIIKNCAANATVTGNNINLGGFVGRNVQNCSINNCNAKGLINGSGGIVGGFVGINEGNIDSSYTEQDVLGSNFVGGFCGINRGSITISYATGNASGNDFVGGFVGDNYWNSSISNCFATGNVSGNNLVGAFEGRNAANSVTTNCYATGNASGNDFVGGFVGQNYNNGYISVCYSIGQVNGNSYIGGFAGDNYLSTIENSYGRGSVNSNVNYGGGFCARNNNTISNCYSTGNVSGNGIVGGFCASNNMILYNCFWDTTSSGINYSMGGIGLPTTQMHYVNTYLNANWDFVGESSNGTADIWQIGQCTNDGYPVFYWQQLILPTYDTIFPVACSSYTSPSGNYTWTTSGTYTDTIPNGAGCDSVITINLTVNSTTYSTISPVACDSYISPSGNYTWTTSGTYMDTIPNGAGCDSVITINLTIYNPQYDTLTVSSCDSYTWLQNNMTYTTSGVYYDTITGVVGGVCDSIYVLNLTIYNPQYDTLTVSSCDSYTWSQNNMTYTTSGVYYDTIANAVGGLCDSIYVLNLTIYNPQYDTLTVSSCDSYTWMQNGMMYTTSGVYYDTIVNAVGGVCDSIYVLNLTIKTVDATVTDSLTTLTAVQAGASYQWVLCPGFAPIAGATNQSFTAMINGYYAVIVTLNGCTDTSICVPVSSVGIKDNVGETGIKLYPNPTIDGHITLQTDRLCEQMQVVIRDVTGKQISVYEFKNTRQADITIEEESKGLYFIEIMTKEGIRKNYKVIKQ